MAEVTIVTDSSTLFVNPNIVSDYSIVVVPASLTIGDTVFKLGVDIGHEEALIRLQSTAGPVRIEPPTPEQFVAVYEQAVQRHAPHVVSIHTSAKLSKACQNATTASRMILGRCEVAVIDSQSISMGVGMLTDKAAQLAYMGSPFDEIVRETRKAVEHIYSIFYVESFDALCRNGFISESQAILGNMLGIKPFVTIEEGELVLIEKVTTVSQAIDKLAEFASEFISVDQMGLLAPTTELTEPMRLLQDRLALELGHVEFPIYAYGAMLGVTLGLDALGIVILENEEEILEDDEVIDDFDM